MKKFFNKIEESGFTLIELMISMGLLTFVMAISMNILSIVLEMTNDADYSVVITQESNYASERIKRIVRSAEDFTVSDGGTTDVITDDTLTVSLEGKKYVFSIGTNADGKYILTEKIDSGIANSVMSSEVYLKQLALDSDNDGVDDISYPIFSDVEDVGVRMAFEIYHKYDENESAGAFVYTQAIGRNAILN